MFELFLYTANGQGPRPILARSWSQIASFGGASMQSTGAYLNDLYYIFGGRVGISSTARQTAFKYNGTVATGIANMPAALCGPCCAVVNGKIYIFGGAYSLVNGNENKSVFAYDPVANTYATVGTAAFNTIVGTAVAVGTDVYIYGGLANQVESGFPKVFYRYDTVGNTWETLPYHDGPAVYTTTILAFGTDLYVYGGETDGSGGRDRTMRVFDTLTKTWHTIAAPALRPSGRSISACKIGEEGFLIVGGRLADNQISNETWYYDIALNTWTKCNPMVINTSFNTLLTNGEKIYTFDGYNGGSNTLNAIYEFK